MASKIVSFFTAAALTMTCSYSSMASMDTGYFTVSSEQTPTCMEAVTPPRSGWEYGSDMGYGTRL